MYKVIKQRVESLRALLKEKNINGYIVPTTDEYLSEYVPNHARRLKYISGFSGSNGLAFTLENTILFFTDGRYLTQCLKELDDNLFEVYDLKNLAEFEWDNYLDEHHLIGYDPHLFTKNDLKRYSKVNLKAISDNLIDLIWEDKPAKSSSKVYNYSLEYAGEDSRFKLKRCRDFIKKHDAQALLIANPESVCWLLNIRAHDVEFSPILLAHAIVTSEKIFLFTNKKRVNNQIFENNSELIILPENRLSEIITQFDEKILYDEDSCSEYIVDIIQSQPLYANVKNPCLLWKAKKNKIEIEKAKEAHIHDAVAVCEFLNFLENTDLIHLSEYNLGEKLAEFRSKRPGYVMDSFASICGYQDNSAVIHYRASRESAKKIVGEGMLLIDSGGQYLGATTDITRTIFIGQPEDKHKKIYTQILKGHIALSHASFPAHCVSGAHLDILARQFLWSDGKDYSHGTGHGVGSFLSVHEGPQSVSPTGFQAKLEKSMIISNEPGYYIAGEFGIRIENLIYVKESKYNNFFNFENLTLVPYSKKLINLEMLSQIELNYLQNYYKNIQKLVKPLLSEAAKIWLEKEIKEFI